MRLLIKSDKFDALRIVRNAYRLYNTQASTYKQHAMMNPMQSGVRKITKYSGWCCVAGNERMRGCVSAESDCLQLCWRLLVAVRRVKPQQRGRYLGGGKNGASKNDFASQRWIFGFAIVMSRSTHGAHDEVFHQSRVTHPRRDARLDNNALSCTSDAPSLNIGKVFIPETIASHHKLYLSPISDRPH